MATAAKNTRSMNDSAEHVVQANERFVEAGKRAGNLYLDGYDKLVESVTSVQRKLAEQSHNDAVKSVIETQVGITRGLASAYTSAARELIG